MANFVSTRFLQKELSNKFFDRRVVYQHWCIKVTPVRWADLVHLGFRPETHSSSEFAELA